MILTDRQVTEICKIGMGKECCRYLGIGKGFECLKSTSLAKLLDDRVKAGTMYAQGDNCDGNGKVDDL